MKIRFWHWWIYRLYCCVWAPILMDKPAMVWGMVQHQKRWLKRHPPPPEIADLEDQMCPNCLTPWKCNGPHIPMEKK